MNVVDNLNSVQVINKPCVCTRTMQLSALAALRRDREQEVQRIPQRRLVNTLSFINIIADLMILSLIYFLNILVLLNFQRDCVASLGLVKSGIIGQSWFRYQAPTIKKMFNCPCLFIQAFKSPCPLNTQTVRICLFSHECGQQIQIAF